MWEYCSEMGGRDQCWQSRGYNLLANAIRGNTSETYNARIT